MVQDLVHNLCESLVENIGGVSGATSRKVVVATPVITLTGNSVTITCATTGATIYYTLDGSTPTSSSSQYSSAFTLDSSCTIKAIAIKGGKSSGIAEEEYVKPITYLTQWRMMGNSVVHTDEYLTQWKVEGNSVVDNNTILSCGDLGQDGKYHVKISNGVTIYDIPLTEPLRKVNDVADTIEFADGVATLTRRICYVADMSTLVFARYGGTSQPGKTLFRAILPIISADINDNDFLCTRYSYSPNTYYCEESAYLLFDGQTKLIIYDSVYNGENDAGALKTSLRGVELIYAFATPTTETIQVSPFPVSPTDTYTSANDTPYSAFEHTENKEIWSCGEYNATDGKYHILVQPLGGSIADIALDEPLRKVNNVADTIEFANGTTVVTRNIVSIDISTLRWVTRYISEKDLYRYSAGAPNNMKPASDSYIATNMLCAIYTTQPEAYMWNADREGIGFGKASDPVIYLYDSNYDGVDMIDALVEHLQGVELIYELATPTTETIQVPQIAEADSYSCVISQGGKAVEWSSFETE